MSEVTEVGLNAKGGSRLLSGGFWTSLSEQPKEPKGALVLTLQSVQDRSCSSIQGSYNAERGGRSCAVTTVNTAYLRLFLCGSPRKHTIRNQVQDPHRQFANRLTVRNGAGGFLESNNVVFCYYFFIWQNVQQSHADKASANFKCLWAYI